MATAQEKMAAGLLPAWLDDALWALLGEGKQADVTVDTGAAGGTGMVPGVLQLLIWVLRRRP